MRDKYFSEFISSFGEATFRQNVAPEVIEKWRGVLPESLLSYWQTEGWSSYSHGLFWTVDPDIYSGIVRDWIENTPINGIDKFHVIARTAFGKLYLWGQKTGASVTLLATSNAIVYLVSDLKKTVKNPDRTLKSFFLGCEPRYCDVDDESGNPLFDRALTRLGPLEPDEMYGFEPAPALGGKLSLSTVNKVKSQKHFSIIRQAAAPDAPFSDIDI